MIESVDKMSKRKISIYVEYNHEVVYMISSSTSISMTTILSIYGAVLSTIVFVNNIKFKKPVFNLSAIMGNIEEKDNDNDNDEISLLGTLYNKNQRPIHIAQMYFEKRLTKLYKKYEMKELIAEYEQVTLGNGLELGSLPEIIVNPNSYVTLNLVSLRYEALEKRKSKAFERSKYILYLETYDGRKIKIKIRE